MLGSFFSSVSSVEAKVRDISWGKKLGELQGWWFKGILIQVHLSSDLP